MQLVQLSERGDLRLIDCLAAGRYPATLAELDREPAPWLRYRRTDAGCILDAEEGVRLPAWPFTR